MQIQNVPITSVKPYRGGKLSSGYYDPSAHHVSCLLWLT